MALAVTLPPLAFSMSNHRAGGMPLLRQWATVLGLPMPKSAASSADPPNSSMILACDMSERMMAVRHDCKPLFATGGVSPFEAV
jgi:hypothetical protein